jgi:lysophospholipase L1-like esterase
MITDNGATLGGSVNPNGYPAEAWFEWGDESTLSSPSETPVQAVGSGSTAQVLAATITGLLPETTYYFRLVAAGPAETVRGPVAGFRTAPAPVPPAVATLAAAIVTTDGAVIQGDVDPNGLPTEAWFEWGANPDPAGFSATPPQVVGEGQEFRLVSETLSGLDWGTDYYYRLAAANAAGVQRGAIIDFRTLVPPTPPVVMTSAATAITTRGAVIQGYVDPNGLPTEAWFEWGAGPDPAGFSATPPQAVEPGGMRAVGETLSGLDPWRTYHYRIAAANAAGTRRSAVMSFPTGEYYVAIGDSITRGSHDDISWDDISSDGRNANGGFEPVLNDLLTAERGYPHTVVNEGVSGTTAADGLASLPSVLARHPAGKFYLILYGANDVVVGVPSGMGLDPDDSGYAGSFKDSMHRIVSAVQGAGKVPFLAKVPFTLYPDLNDGIRDFNAVVDELAAINDIAVVPPDLYAHFEDHQDELSPLPDGRHPNGMGYRSIADLWLGALR